MKENFQFRSIKEGISEKKLRKEFEPLSSEEAPGYTLRDTYLDLRRSLDEEIEGEAEQENELQEERVKLLKELISPDLHKQFTDLLKELNSKTKISKEHPQREFIDIEQGSFKEDIEKWITTLEDTIKAKGKDFNQEDLEEIKIKSWLYFDAIINVLNAKSVEKDINDFYKEKEEKILDEKQKKEAKKEIGKELQARYGLSASETEVIIDLVTTKEIDKYNFNVLINTLKQVWEDYKLGEKKKEFLKISAGFLLSTGIMSFAPSTFKGLGAAGKFSAFSIIEFFGLTQYGGAMEKLLEVELLKVNNEINKKLNEKISNSIFFQEFEFIHDKSLGQVYLSLMRGKAAINGLLSDFTTKFIPELAGIGMSWGFLSQINPYLGAISLSSIPVMYHLAKKDAKKIWPIHERASIEEEKIASEIGAVKEGFEQIRTSGSTQNVSERLQAQLNKGDVLNLEKQAERAKMEIKMGMPFFFSAVTAALVGGVFQQKGLISGGGVLATAIYAERMNRPIREMVNLYYNRFPEYVHDIEKMNNTLGKYEELDLPEGSKEEKRKAVSELENFNIKIKNLKFRDVLQKFNLDINKGEFLTIAGETGAGKTTLLRNLVGLFKPEEGEIEIGGENIDNIKKYGSESIYSVMSYSNQKPIIFPQMTVRENLLLWTQKDIPDKEIKKVLQELNLDELADILDGRISELSGGEQSRLGLARTLLKKPKIMLLDEPTASLDSRSAEEVRNIISRIHKDHPETTIICVSHDADLLKMGDRVVEVEKRKQRKRKS